jgi:hypothetical protein
MTPGKPVVVSSGPMFGSEPDEFIQQIKEQDAGWARVGHALANFLSTAFPQAKNQADALGDAIISLMCTGSERQIARLSQPPPSFPAYGPNPTAVLARLVEDRDRVAAQIDQAMQGVEALRKADNGDGLSNIFEAGVIGPLRRVLAQIEEQISRVQESMEGELDGPTTTE